MVHMLEQAAEEATQAQAPAEVQLQAEEGMQLHQNAARAFSL